MLVSVFPSLGRCFMLVGENNGFVSPVCFLCTLCRTSTCHVSSVITVLSCLFIEEPSIVVLSQEMQVCEGRLSFPDCMMSSAIFLSCDMAFLPSQNTACLSFFLDTIAESTTSSKIRARFTKRLSKDCHFRHQSPKSRSSNLPLSYCLTQQVPKVHKCFVPLNCGVCESTSLAMDRILFEAVQVLLSTPNSECFHGQSST